MYLVVFRNRKRTDIDRAAYEADSARMEMQARAQPGFLSFKSYTAEDGEVVALSEWADEASARAWGRFEEHAHIQTKGREHYYTDYTMFAGAPSRVHRFG